MQKHEANKILLNKFTLEQLHDLCRYHKREMNRLDYESRVILGETDKEIVKKRFIPYIAGLFNESEIRQYADTHQIVL
jgi:hypothetical protein